MDDATQQWTWVAEPEVKALLAAHGATVPRGVVVDDVAGARAAAAGLRAPLVVKLVVPGLVHKSEVGGVRLGLGDADAVAEAAAELLESAARRGGPGPARLLVEEQAPPGIELVVGARSDEGFGPVLLVGLGGIWVEVLDDVAVGFAPLAPGQGRALLRRLRAWPVLAGERGRAAVDLDAVDEVLVAVGRVAADQAGAPFELDANPVIVSPAGAVVADARLGRGPRPPAASTLATGAATGGLDALWMPRRVAVAGADPDRPGLGNALLREYRRAAPARPLVALHPRAADVAEVEGVATVATLAGSAPVDLLTVTVPEADVMATLADAAAGGTKVVHLFTGPSTQDPAARRRWRADVLDTARRGGLRVLGPNAMGVHHAEGGVSFVPGSSLAPGGSVSVVCQSGGLAADLVSLGEASGVRFARVASIGDAIDIDVAELVGSFLDDPATEVIGAYVETAQRGARALHDVLRHAAVPKPVVVLVGGSSPAGARAAGSHTGALSGDRRLWDALAASVGANVVTSLEDFVTTLLCHQRLGRVDVGDRHGALVVATGGDGVLLADLLSAAGVPVPALSDEALHHLEAQGHAGIGRTNPVDLAQLGALLDRGSGDGVLRDVVTGVLGHQPLSEVVVQLGLTSLFLYFPRPERLVDRLLGAVEELCAAQPAARMAVVVHATGVSAEAGREARARLRDVVVVTESARRAAVGLAAVAAHRRSWDD